jgi:tetratricopeptide (TPR) repeat protein
MLTNEFWLRITVELAAMKTTILLALCVVCVPAVQTAVAQPFLIKDAQPRAEIIIAETPPRTTRLAAAELQTYVEKITGATLPITTGTGSDVPVKIYVGQSSHTEKLGITAAGLKDGAYRIVSGENWLVLIGDDTDFVPVEPWPRNNNDIASGRMQAKWNEITGKNWGYTHSQLHKHYSGANSLFGTPKEQHLDKDGNVNVWTYDERGSFNAVCGFLRDLGVRWYMPGEVGEIVPKAKSIALPQIDRTVRPDFPIRILNFRASVYGHDAMMWGFRLGTRQPFGRQAAHGLDRMTDNEHTLTHHPDWFALYGGKRHTQPGMRLHQLCYSNEELFREAVEFARVQFDHYDMDVVSIMPPDGYTAICQCELCEGKESPELGNRGSLSNYVWEFVNRVAKEVAKTHPEKKISNCAYGVYTTPPSNIEKLEPNVQVIIVGGRRPTSQDRDEIRQLQSGWAKKTDNPVEIFENYPFTGRGFYLPAYIPHVMGESINETKGISRGEDIWLTMNFGDDSIGYNHFLIYFRARMYWGGKDQDVVAMFDEYCRLFYGPAANEMRTFFDYCEKHWRDMQHDGSKANHALELFESAKAKASESSGATDSVYGQRIKFVDNYLNGLRNKSVQLAQKRGSVPKVRLVGGEPLAPITIDGKLDDVAWSNCPVASTGRLAELQTGRQPTYGTSFKTAWRGNNLYLAIRCEETVGRSLSPAQQPESNRPLNIATAKDGDQAIWYGDAVEILLDTDSHSYYQIAVNPAGAKIDLDRGASRNNWFNWSSQAEVATHVADDHWTIEIRIPITQDENDPLHQVIGRKPTLSLPWHINVCRQRIRENGSEFSAFSPTGSPGFHKPMKFAHFYGGNSHQFPADETVTDFLIESRAARKLMSARKWEPALAACLALAGQEKLTDLQKSDALERAANCARNLHDYGRAAELANLIPLKAVAKTVHMENLSAERKWPELAERFGDEDLRKWPFWQIGAGAFVRAKAHVFTKNGKAAEADLQTALAYTPDARIRTGILATMGHNRESNLNDDDGALAAYRQNIESKTNIGGAEEFRSVQRAAFILSKQKKFDEAIATFNVVNFENQTGYWRNAMLLARGDVLAAAGRQADAIRDFKAVLADPKADAPLRKLAQERLEASQTNSGM